MTYPRGDVKLTPTQRDAFVGDYPIGNVQFLRDSTTNAVRGFTVGNGRVRNLKFVRTHLE